MFVWLLSFFLFWWQKSRKTRIQPAALCQWDCCRTEQSWLSKGVLCAQLFIFKTYYKIRQCVITIHDSAAYYNLRQPVITIHDSLVITILRNFYNKRQIFLRQYYSSRQNAMTSYNMAECFGFFTFFTLFFVFSPRKSYWENILFNRLACKRYFNTSLRLLYNSFWLRTWLWKLGNMTYFKIRLKFYTTPQLSFNITYTYEPISTKSSAHFPEINEQLLK